MMSIISSVLLLITGILLLLISRELRIYKNRYEEHLKLQKLGELEYGMQKMEKALRTECFPCRTKWQIRLILWKYWFDWIVGKEYYDPLKPDREHFDYWRME